ncbi:DUF3459 domain-containing protein [Sorangium sp. So ce321]|uniref:DUF3459 domain-containing protein n=1 Tax=Sorangium sp. So ce321 TaxID=3133300 RepID=UPI003F615AF2
MADRVPAVREAEIRGIRYVACASGRWRRHGGGGGATRTVALNLGRVALVAQPGSGRSTSVGSPSRHPPERIAPQ